jgi:hypothetical protein
MPAINFSVDMSGCAYLRNSDGGATPEVFRFSISNGLHVAGQDQKTVKLVIENETFTIYNQHLRGRSFSEALSLAIWTIDKLLILNTNPEYY